LIKPRTCVLTENIHLKETARNLYFLGATVILACRNETEANRTIEEFETRHNQSSPTNKVKPIFIPLNLESFDSVVRFVDKFLELNLPLHLLILNAGIPLQTDYSTADCGYEKVFTVNYLSHFLLTQKLLPRLRSSVPARVVCISCKLHFDPTGETLFDIMKLPPLPEHYESGKTFALSKLALIMFARLFNSRYARLGVSAVSLHPTANSLSSNPSLATHPVKTVSAQGTGLHQAALNVVRFLIKFLKEKLFKVKILKCKGLCQFIQPTFAMRNIFLYKYLKISFFLLVSFSKLWN
jgi:NAD(P)-dependent dehydrogenase (short-subunit alcohol dehydrogenase family)